MAEEDLFIETPFEPKAIIPRASVIKRSTVTTKLIKACNNLTLVKPLGKGKFPVFMARCNEQGRSYAMKLFVKDDQQQVDKYFENEVKFSSLSHPNILKIIHHEQNRKIKLQNFLGKASIILSELAPYGDFFNFVLKNKKHITEKLARTFFRQLIEGLEYLHKHNIAHLDIKLENLLIGENFILKIADFDLATFTNDRDFGKGTKFYRAPEIIQNKCKDGAAADIYSAGVVLFTLLSKGVIPHAENSLYKGIDFFNLLNNDNPEFWRKHCEVQGQSSSVFSKNFRELFNGMLKLDPEQRFTVQDVKNSEWYNEEVLTMEEVKEWFQEFFQQ